MNKQPSIAIIIVNWNGLSITDECLQSVKTIDYPNCKTILVDNGSSDGSASFFKEHYPEVDLITLETNTGFTGGNNAGIERALENSFDYVLLLNNDTIVSDPDFLTKMVAACEDTSEIGMACPTILYDKPEGRVWYAGGWLNLWRGWGHYYTVPEDSQVQRTGYTTGCCLLVKSETIRAIGLLNEAYFLSVEDVEWSLRAQKSGWQTVYISEPSIIHKDSVSSRDKTQGKFSPTRVYYGFRNSIWLIREYASFWQKLIVWPFLFGIRYLYRTAGYTLLGRWRKLKALTRALRDGLNSDEYLKKNNQ